MITTPWRVARRRTAPSLTVAAALIAGLTACTGPTAPTTPSVLCGRTVDPDLLRSLLPDGEIKAKQESVGDPQTSNCVVTVDGSRRLYINEIRDQKYFEVQKKISVGPNPKQSGTSGNAVISDGWYVSMSPCHKRGSKSNYVLDVILSVSHAQAHKKRSQLEKFATAYRPEGLRAMGCR
ncbi:hypothetical protein [Streptomyces sp. HB132]|uniref:hypothetical protein n=1 Tax=Streptomyces sp. HB132 TaxID=767388 RepID=UPI0019606391|nr:hypothetical protein [Streptomyces sp. HB132]MBM7441415.1 hypothetical protein [Streptomyces sp. HB132]